MTYAAKYRENKDLIQRYTDYLLSFERNAYKEDRKMIAAIDDNDVKELIAEIGRLINENKAITNAAINDTQFLDYEYITDTNIVSSELDSSGQDRVHS